MFYRLTVAVISWIAPVAHAEPYHLGNSGWNCQGFLYCPPGGGAPPTNVVFIITTTIIAGVAAFIGSLAIVVFFYGAIRMVISQGQEGKEAGKKALIWASLGLAAALLTEAVIQFVRGYIYFVA